MPFCIHECFRVKEIGVNKTRKDHPDPEMVGDSILVETMHCENWKLQFVWKCLKV
jgi:hypothetical protein